MLLKISGDLTPVSGDMTVNHLYKHVKDLEQLRWLDWIFLGGYLPSLSINYVAMSKDNYGKKVTTTVLYKGENFL